VWYDGARHSVPTYDLPWLAGEPSQSLYSAWDEACAGAVLSASHRLLMFDNPCSSVFKRSSICKVNIHQKKNKNDAIETDCQKFRDIRYMDSCYHYEREGGSTLARDSAERMCKKANGTLAIFESEAEWKEVGGKLEKMSGGEVWIGGRARVKGGDEYQWGVGKPIGTGENGFGWWKDQPRNHGKVNDCVLTSTHSTTGEYGW
jgi:hypothetical protein